MENFILYLLWSGALSFWFSNVHGFWIYVRMYGLITFYIRYKPSAYLSIPALISGLPKMPQNLNLELNFLVLVHIHCEESLLTREW